MNALGMAGSFLQEARIGRRSPRFCLGRLWSGWLDRGEVPDPQHDLVTNGCSAKAFTRCSKTGLRKLSCCSQTELRTKT